MATATETALPEAAVPENFWESIPDRIREFVWLTSGMFSAAALALSFMGYFTLNSSATAAQNFAAAVASAVGFGVCTLLKYGPESA